MNGTISFPLPTYYMSSLPDTVKPSSESNLHRIGASSFGTIMGFSSLISMLGMSIGPIFAGYMADVYGDYELGFLIIASSAFVGSFCFFAATPPKRPISSRSV